MEDVPKKVTKKIYTDRIQQFQTSDLHRNVRRKRLVEGHGVATRGGQWVH